MGERMKCPFCSYGKAKACVMLLECKKCGNHLGKFGGGWEE